MKNRAVWVITRWLVAVGVACVLVPWGVMAGEKSGLGEELIEAL